MSGTFSQPLTGYRLVATRADDTLKKIALRELGDPTQWVNLVALNGLTPPWMVYSLAEAASVGGTVLLAGQSQIKIPGPAPAPAAVTDPDTVYGIDCLLQDGDLVVDATGDLAVVEGVANLEQALKNALRTQPGELLAHPSYGCKIYSLIGKGASSSIGLLAAKYVSQTLQADPRISTVQDAAATITGDVVATSAEAVTVDGKVVPVGISN